MAEMFCFSIKKKKKILHLVQPYLSTKNIIRVRFIDTQDNIKS